MSSQQDHNLDVKSTKLNIFGKSLQDPILGRHFKLPGQFGVEQPVKLDTSLSYIPVYAHLKVYDVELLKRPSTPPAIKRIEQEDYMEFYTPQRLNKKIVETSPVKIDIMKKEKRITKISK